MTRSRGSRGGNGCSRQRAQPRQDGELAVEPRLTWNAFQSLHKGLGGWDELKSRWARYKAGTYTVPAELLSCDDPGPPAAPRDQGRRRPTRSGPAKPGPTDKDRPSSLPAGNTAASVGVSSAPPSAHPASPALDLPTCKAEPSSPAATGPLRVAVPPSSPRAGAGADAAVSPADAAMEPQPPQPLQPAGEEQPVERPAPAPVPAPVAASGGSAAADGAAAAGCCGQAPEAVEAGARGTLHAGEGGVAGTDGGAASAAVPAAAAGARAGADEPPALQPAPPAAQPAPLGHALQAAPGTDAAPRQLRRQLRSSAPASAAATATSVRSHAAPTEPQSGRSGTGADLEPQGAHRGCPAKAPDAPGAAPAPQAPPGRGLQRWLRQAVRGLRPRAGAAPPRVAPEQGLALSPPRAQDDPPAPPAQLHTHPSPPAQLPTTPAPPPPAASGDWVVAVASPPPASPAAPPEASTPHEPAPIAAPLAAPPAPAVTAPSGPCEGSACAVPGGGVAAARGGVAAAAQRWLAVAASAFRRRPSAAAEGVGIGNGGEEAGGCGAQQSQTEAAVAAVASEAGAESKGEEVAGEEWGSPAASCDGGWGGPSELSASPEAPAGIPRRRLALGSSAEAGVLRAPGTPPGGSSTGAAGPHAGPGALVPAPAGTPHPGARAAGRCKAGSQDQASGSGRDPVGAGSTAEADGPPCTCGGAGEGVGAIKTEPLAPAPLGPRGRCFEEAISSPNPGPHPALPGSGVVAGAGWECGGAGQAPTGGTKAEPPAPEPLGPMGVRADEASASLSPGPSPNDRGGGAADGASPAPLLPGAGVGANGGREPPVQAAGRRHRRLFTPSQASAGAVGLGAHYSQPQPQLQPCIQSPQPVRYIAASPNTRRCASNPADSASPAPEAAAGPSPSSPAQATPPGASPHRSGIAGNQLCLGREHERSREETDWEEAPARQAPARSPDRGPSEPQAQPQPQPLQAQAQAHQGQAQAHQQGPGPVTTWNGFQRAMAGRGLSGAQLGALWRRHKAGEDVVGRPGAGAGAGVGGQQAHQVQQPQAQAKPQGPTAAPAAAPLPRGSQGGGSAGRGKSTGEARGRGKRRQGAAGRQARIGDFYSPAAGEQGQQDDEEDGEGQPPSSCTGVPATSPASSTYSQPAPPAPAPDGGEGEASSAGGSRLPEASQRMPAAPPSRPRPAPLPLPPPPPLPGLAAVEAAVGALAPAVSVFGDGRLSRERDVEDDDPRFFAGFSPWARVLPGDEGALKRVRPPARPGVYEWGVRLPGGTRVTAFYLGQAGGGTSRANLRSRFCAYAASTCALLGPSAGAMAAFAAAAARGQAPARLKEGAKSALWWALQLRGCSFHYRYRVCDKSLPGGDPASVEGALLGAINYAGCQLHNGPYRRLALEFNYTLEDLPVSRPQLLAPADAPAGRTRAQTRAAAARRAEQGGLGARVAVGVAGAGSEG
ncbi:hypothetical protein HYH03_017070 [Edaphochlamys debaryana]|uniref:Uncharacterized protein n=1 Tax=Edaphochlamys debaryana TaxID=47281 RepID=A0A836BPI5_9CHLO|nr:hypothetical protein HYH03_017070 [Edaphochlamys debaryana]|eukprot:KAG2484120.1 hypothetical protein HYH03_017070 [Edaphochlamys debaryana]